MPHHRLALRQARLLFVDDRQRCHQRSVSTPFVLRSGQYRASRIRNNTCDNRICQLLPCRAGGQQVQFVQFFLPKGGNPAPHIYTRFFPGRPAHNARGYGYVAEWYQVLNHAEGRLAAQALHPGGQCAVR